MESKQSPSVYACWDEKPRPHPFYAHIVRACGYEKKREDRRCQGCHAGRDEWPHQQALGAPA